jgi:hypothetical protein
MKLRGNITNTGYLKGSPDEYNDFNIIPSNKITMKGVNKKLKVTPIRQTQQGYLTGRPVTAMPNQDYSFPGYNAVIETPILAGGGVTSPGPVSPPTPSISNMGYDDRMYLYNYINDYNAKHAAYKYTTDEAADMANQRELNTPAARRAWKLAEQYNIPLLGREDTPTYGKNYQYGQYVNIPKPVAPQVTTPTPKLPIADTSPAATVPETSTNAQTSPYVYKKKKFQGFHSPQFQGTGYGVDNFNQGVQNTEPLAGMQFGGIIPMYETPMMNMGGQPCYECGGFMASGGNWIPSNLKKGRCTPAPNLDCPKGSPQYNLAMTFKKHHGFHKAMGGDTMPAQYEGLGDVVAKRKADYLSSIRNQALRAMANQEAAQMATYVKQMGGEPDRSLPFDPIAMANNPAMYNPYDPSNSDMYSQENMGTDYFERDLGAADMGDYSNYKSQPEEKREPRKFDPESMFNSALTIGSYLASIGENRQRQDYENKLKKRMNADNLYTPIPGNMNSRGDYDINSGLFRPDQQVPVQFRGYTKYGGYAKPSYQVGGEYDLTDDQLQELINSGVEFDIID